MAMQAMQTHQEESSVLTMSNPVADMAQPLLSQPTSPMQQHARQGQGQGQGPALVDSTGDAALAAVCSRVQQDLRQASGLIEEQWSILHPVLCCWLVSSMINMLVLYSRSFWLAEVAAVIGVVGAARATIPSCRGDLDLVTLMKHLHVLGLTALLLDVVTLAMTDGELLAAFFACSEQDDQVCGLVRVLGAFYTLVLGSHAMLSFLTSRAARSCASVLPQLPSSLQQA